MATTKNTPCDKSYCGHIRMHHALNEQLDSGECAVAGCECKYFLPPPPVANPTP